MSAKTELHEGWHFRQAGHDEWMNASVPGCNFSDLQRNNKIEDPHAYANENLVQWVEEQDWEYELNFDLTDNSLNYQSSKLIFEGLDTYADVYLNGELILSADNMFMTWEVEVQRHLKVENNNLRLYFHSPIKIGRQRKKDITYPAGNDRSDEKLSVFTRKAPYHFGWDWGPRLVTSGIFRSVRLQHHNLFEVQDIYLRTEQLEQDKAIVFTELSIDMFEPGTLDVNISCTTDQFEPITISKNLESGEQ